MIVGEARARAGTNDVLNKRALPQGRTSVVAHNFRAIKVCAQNARIRLNRGRALNSGERLHYNQDDDADHQQRGNLIEHPVKPPGVLVAPRGKRLAQDAQITMHA